MALVKKVDKKNCESAQDMLPKSNIGFGLISGILKKKAKHI